MQMSAGAHNSQRHQSSPVLELQVFVSYPVWVSGIKLGSSKEQSTFLTAEPSLLSQQSVSVLNVMCI